MIGKFFERRRQKKKKQLEERLWREELQRLERRRLEIAAGRDIHSLEVIRETMKAGINLDPAQSVIWDYHVNIHLPLMDRIKNDPGFAKKYVEDQIAKLPELKRLLKKGEDLQRRLGRL